MLLVDICLTVIEEVYDCHQVLKFSTPHVDDGMLMTLGLQQAPKKRAGSGQDNLVGFNLLAIFTGQGDICKLVVTSQFFETCQDVFLKVIPIQTKFLSAHYVCQSGSGNSGSCLNS